MPAWTDEECVRVIEFSGMVTMPKGQFSGPDYLDFAIADAVVDFNVGKECTNYIFPLLGLKWVYTLKCMMKSGILVVLVPALEKVPFETIQKKHEEG